MRKLERARVEERRQGIRRRRSIRIRQKICILCTFCLIMILSCGYALASDEGEKQEWEKRYTSIEVQSGDTLWDLAGTYAAGGYSDRDDFIREVKQLNHLTDDNITAGVYLIIPYYISL